MPSKRFKYYIPYIAANSLEAGYVVVERDSEIETLEDVLAIAKDIMDKRRMKVTIINWKRIANASTRR